MHQTFNCLLSFLLFVIHTLAAIVSIFLPSYVCPIAG
jgi:hypothetical protein